MSERTEPAERTRSHRLRPMVGRDPQEPHRAATPLELLFDLTFVVAFGVAGEQFAHLIAEGHLGSGLAGFTFAMFSIIWAWINFTWFASAYDTDDWIYRITTMVQMVGVVIMTLGMPQMFASIDRGVELDNSVMVSGYIVMRVAMVFQWLRAARNDPAHRSAALTFALTLVLAQIGWVAVVIAPLTVEQAFAVGAVLILVEMTGPVIAERYKGGTPWHVHHIVERHGLLVIITLGEGVIGTVASLSAVVGRQGWSLNAILVAIAGIGLTFGLWWVYYMIPSAEVLSVFRGRSIVWALSHIPLFASLAAVGASLHVAAYYIDDAAHISAKSTVLTVATPVAVYLLLVYMLYAYLVRVPDPFHLFLLAATGATLALAVVLAQGGVSMAWCLIVVMVAPVVTVVGYEAIGHRHQSRALAISLGTEQR
ncbi:membrane protein [Nocardia neocaledoniensis NBRC 108232]|uniref:Low temperature requirement protein LtrA n=1 Tax=Nocardia neocaledoniensis TaxID=236511 RepID=A0A317NXM8_9NOCA|nr:low temperature requirement protein A [Nocardia neocaledoniensis]PWV79722.1 low temperature requirement protein LtrA [Nocardia neocaledoniensis]GEM31508.1 membrane protein [Nocardia neocaledoniensis NBRC 108232]